MERISRFNIRRVAEEMALDHIFLKLNNGILESSFYPPVELPFLVALKKLQKMRSELFHSGPIPITKHIFAIYEVKQAGLAPENHVVLFSVIWNGEFLAITLHDNLNEPISITSPLFMFADKLIKFFIEVDKEQLMYEELVSIFAQKNDDQAKLSQRFKESILSDKNQLLDYLFEQWVEKTKKDSLTSNTLSLIPFNMPIKSLKLLDGNNKKSIAKNLVLKTYEAMLHVIRDHQESDKSNKSSQVDLVIKAIKKSFEQKIVSLSGDSRANELFEMAQNLRASLQVY